MTEERRAGGMAEDGSYLAPDLIEDWLRDDPNRWISGHAELYLLPFRWDGNHADLAAVRAGSVESVTLGSRVVVETPKFGGWRLITLDAQDVEIPVLPGTRLAVGGAAVFLDAKFVAFTDFGAEFWAACGAPLPRWEVTLRWVLRCLRRGRAAGRLRDWLRDPEPATFAVKWGKEGIASVDVPPARRIRTP